MAGETAHACAIACTAGLVKAIQRAGSQRMRAEWLPRLLDPDYDRRLHGAQFLTEVQGGSDVGANACVARPDPTEPGAFRLSGEKWFCSNVHADLYAVTARPEGAGPGTGGLAAFVVPRRLDGRPNGALVRRLKSKLGTRPLPTAEVDFQEARAWPLGSLEGGFKLMIGVVINTSRLAVATGCAGAMARAYDEARRYAALRQAFGRPLVEFPAVRQQLAEMRALATAGLSLTLFVAALEDRLTLAGAPPEDDALFRTAVNLAKFVCSVDAVRVVHHAIEILGGNGTIEDFSPLPRLYRDAPVQESWEGPHNTLMAQMLRDAHRAKMHDALSVRAEEVLHALRHPGLGPARAAAAAALDDVRAELATLLRAEPDAAAYHFRAVAERLARVFQAALLLEEADAALARGEATGLPAVARFFVDRHVRRDYAPAGDPGYAGRLAEVLA
jgi:alkylation response protein AidB-like acyl-CoA dehydrogenase